MSRITKNPEVRKQEILDTAIKLFCEKGYEQTTMLDISKAMNVSQGLCYRYFSSKEVIYQSVLDYYVSQGVAQFKKALGDKDKCIKDVIDSLTPLKNENHSNDNYHRFFNLYENSKLHTQMEIALLIELVPIVKERIASANDKGEIKIDSVEDVSAFLLFGQFGLSLCSIQNDESKLEESKKIFKRILGIN